MQTESSSDNQSTAKAQDHSAVNPISASPFRNRFCFPRSNKLGRDKVYLDGNSLGPMLREVPQRMREVVEDQWSGKLIGGWNSGWMDLPTVLGDLVGQIIGANPGETLIADSTSINLYKLAVAALHAMPDRDEIVTDEANFPSDRFVLESLQHAFQRPIRLTKFAWDWREPEKVLDRLNQVVSSRTGLVCLSHVDYRSGHAFDIAQVTNSVQARGARILWDLSHSVGVVPIALSDCKADMAVGCTYKFLNGGPGAPAFLYVRKDLQTQLQNPIAGWLSAAKPFEFGDAYEPSASIRRFWVGTPPILSMAAIEPGLRLTIEAGLDWIRHRSIALTEHLIQLASDRLVPLGFHIATPKNPAHRGSHVALAHDEGWRITQALIDRYDVIPDFRPPNLVRLGIAPLYNEAEEVAVAVDSLERTVRNREFMHYASTATGVT